MGGVSNGKFAVVFPQIVREGREVRAGRGLLGEYEAQQLDRGRSSGRAFVPLSGHPTDAVVEQWSTSVSQDCVDRSN